VVPAFFLKLLALEGAGPVLDRCASCGEATELVAFDIHEGGALCRNCRRGVALGPEALGLMRRILGGDLAAALSEGEGPVVHQVALVASTALETHLERRLRSLRVLERG
jgi:DNA repair protein RecO (recombination protein O)